MSSGKYVRTKNGEDVSLKETSLFVNLVEKMKDLKKHIIFKLNPYLQQRQQEKRVWIFPIMLAYYATYLRDKGNQVVWDKEDDGSCDKIITSEEQIDMPFLESKCDRVLTDALNPKWWKNNGNFKMLPGAYIQSSNTCHYKQCTFCIETKKNLPYLVRPVDSVLDEIGECINMGFKSLFDDSATFPGGMWTIKFCEGMIARGYNKKIRIGCNMRLDYCHPNDRGMAYMKEAGFQMILYGLESANQATLDRLNKGVNINSAIDNIKRSAKAGLDVHLAFMVGYNWETREEAMKTINLVKWLLIKGYAHTAQCSFYTPPNHEGDYRQKDLVKKIYEVGYNPEFWVRRIVNIRNLNDMRYIWKGIKSAFR